MGDFALTQYHSIEGKGILRTEAGCYVSLNTSAETHWRSVQRSFRRDKEKTAVEETCDLASAASKLNLKVVDEATSPASGNMHWDSWPRPLPAIPILSFDRPLVSL